MFRNTLMTVKMLDDLKKYEKRHVKSLLIFIKALSDEESLSTFAKDCKTTKGNLLQIAYGGNVSAKLSKIISEKSNGVVLLEELRPDIF